jgi:hypothetical protein
MIDLHELSIRVRQLMESDEACEHLVRDVAHTFGSAAEGLTLNELVGALCICVVNLMDRDAVTMGGQ